MSTRLAAEMTECVIGGLEGSTEDSRRFGGSADKSACGHTVGQKCTGLRNHTQHHTGG